MVLNQTESSQALGESYKKDATVLDAIGDLVLNAFAKVKVPDEKFVEMKDSVDKLEANIQGIERLHSKLLQTQAGIESSFKVALGTDYSALASAIGSLGAMETQMTEPLTQFAEGMEEYAELNKQKV